MEQLQGQGGKHFVTSMATVLSCRAVEGQQSVVRQILQGFHHLGSQVCAVAVSECCESLIPCAIPCSLPR